MEDANILELFHARSETAIQETEAKYGAYCRYIASHILTSEEDADECVNDTLLRAWNSIPPHCPENLGAYLGKLTRNLALDRRRHLSAAKRGAGEIPLVLEELRNVVSPDGDPEEALDEKLLAQMLNRFLGTLSKEQRIIFLRRYWYFSSVREIAADLGIGESKVKMSLLRSRNALKNVLEKEGISL